MPMHLTIAGNCLSERYEFELKSLVEKYGLQDCTSFKGFVNREDLPELYRKHSVLLFPSVWEEPMGISILEAMASGMVVISSGTGGSEELFSHGESGLFFKSGNAEDLAAQMTMLLMNPQRIHNIGQEARKKACSDFCFSSTLQAIKNCLIKTTRG